jgi:hypothetical protein
MNISVDSWCLGRDSKRAPPEYESVTSQTDLTDRMKVLVRVDSLMNRPA